MELYHTTDMEGVSELNPDEARMQQLIAQLEIPEFEEADHPDLSLVHDPSGWALTLYPRGIVTYEQLEDDDGQPLFMTGIGSAQALQLWKSLARGDINALKQLPWQRDQA